MDTARLRAELPKPIATVYAQAIETDPDAPGEQAQRFLDVFEVTAQYLALSGVAMHLRASPGKTSASSDIRKLLRKNLRETSAGKWVGLVRELHSLSLLDGDVGCSLLGCSGEERLGETGGFVQLRKAVDAKGGGRATVLEILDWLPFLRNELAHKRITLGHLAANVDPLRNTIETLLSSIPALAQRPMVEAWKVSPVRYQGVATWEVVFRVFKGEATPRQELPPRYLPQHAALFRGGIYLRLPGDDHVELSPWVLSQGNDVFLFSGYDKKGRPQYVCPYARIDGPDLGNAMGALRERAPFLFEPEPDETRQPGPESPSGPPPAQVLKNPQKYRDRFAAALFDDGRVDEKERLFLDDIRESCGLAEEEALAIEREVQVEFRAQQHRRDKAELSPTIAQPAQPQACIRGDEPIHAETPPVAGPHSVSAPKSGVDISGFLDRFRATLPRRARPLTREALAGFLDRFRASLLGSL